MTEDDTDPVSAVANMIEGAPAPVVELANEAAPDAAEGEPQTLRTGGFDVDVINRDHALVVLGTKAVVVRERPNAPVKDRVQFLGMDAFYTLFANRFTEARDADGKTRTKQWGRVWVAHPDRREFEGIEFFPNPDGVPGTPGYLNLWHGFGIEPSEAGSWDIFRDHLRNNVCGGNDVLFDYVLGWIAHIVQRPRERIGTALVLRGLRGSGKSKVGEVVGSLIPAHYFQVDDARYITGQFNAHMASCLLLQGDEAVWAGDKAAEGRLKGLITSEYQMLESKGIDPIRIRNFVRVLMTSNEDWVIPAGKDERRFIMLDVDPRCAQNHEYFAEMDAQLEQGGRARLLYDLQRLDLDRLNLRQIPQTRALFEQKLRSLDSVEIWWFGRLTEGTPTRELTEWPQIVSVDALYNDYLRASSEVGAGRKRDRSNFGIELARLVPNLGHTRPRVEVEGKVRRVYSYVLPRLDDCRSAFDNLVSYTLDWPIIASEGDALPPADAVDAGDGDAVPV